MKLKTIASIVVLASALVCTAAEPQVVWLDELPLDDMSIGWHEPRKNKSVEGNPLQIGAKIFARFENLRPLDKPGYHAPKGYPCAECPKNRARP